MKIKELRAGAGIELKAEIIEIEPIKTPWKCFNCDSKGASEIIEKCPYCSAEETKEKGKGLWVQNQKVTNAIIKDDSGTARLILWNKDIKYKIGDKIHLVNGYAREYEGILKVSKGKYGSILKE